MKKPTLKRLALGFIQHLIAAGIMIAVAAILFNSYLGVESINASQTYWLDPLDTEPVFEDSLIFHEILDTAVADIVEYVAIQKEMETKGEFDSEKHIDITQYARRKGAEDTCEATAVYKLEDLIRWGKNGVEYSNRAMSMSDFVNYFGPAASKENFALDESGQLYFVGFRSGQKGEDQENTGVLSGEETDPVLQEQERELEKAMESYTTEQLEDMAYSYIMADAAEEIRSSREDDGSLTIYISMLSCRYETIDGERQLSAYADNWSDYLELQRYLADAIESFAGNYEKYQRGQELYKEGRSNLHYAIRMVTDEGKICTYTNVSGTEGLTDGEITEYFSEYRRYFVYFLDNLEFTGITSLTEGEVYRFISNYGYAFPEQTRIWMAVDTAYAVEGDAFYDAYTVFGRIVPNIFKIIGVIAVLAVIWLMLAGYLTLTAGAAYDDTGEKVYYLSRIDHIWTEVMILLTVGLIYGMNRGILMLGEVADLVYSSHSELLGMSETKLYEYGSFGLFGMLASFGFSTIWFSLLRRLHAGNLLKESFCSWLLQCVHNGIHFIFSHRNTVVSTLIPYNLFLLINLIGAFLAFARIDSGRFQTVLLIIGLVAADGLVGVWLFRRNAERMDIVEGIKRIRDGEVEYKIEVDSLTGTNRELADAVNNIGEGIRKAVDTSMKDEQMKSDLITNVSHDIKTPLTSIISYVDLLKRLQIKEEPARGYIDILEGKTQRLKQLTDDLVEASKITSGNIVLNQEMLDLTELLNQTVGEFSEKLEEKNLQLVFEDCNIPAYIYADSRRMWRVVENLFNNICKYALENTRVYLELLVKEQKVEMSIKNISEQQMNIKGEELTERFIRGDSSRATEGSGLGLFIAKSLTQVQGGTFEIQLDGDLFKVILCFPEYIQKEVCKE